MQYNHPLYTNSILLHRIIRLGLDPEPSRHRSHNAPLGRDRSPPRAEQSLKARDPIDPAAILVIIA